MSTPTMQPHEPATPAPGTPAAVGRRAVGSSRWRILPLQLGAGALATAGIFELFATLLLDWVTLPTATKPPSESTLQWTAWLFNYTPGFITYAYPPILLGVAIVVAVIPGFALVVPDRDVLTGSQQAAGLMPRVITARRRTKLVRPFLPQLRADLSSAGYSRRMLRARGRIWLVLVAEFGALTTLAFSSYTLVTKDAVFTDPSGYAFTGNLDLGVGPIVCFAASLLLAIGLVPVWPRRSDRTFLVLPDGRAVAEN